MRPRRLRRINGFSYTGPNRYFLTICAHDRRSLFENGELAECVRTQLLESASSTGYTVVAYCIMPNHVHMLVEGADDSDPLPAYVKRFKQISGYRGRRIIDAPVWQHGYYERVLREKEDTRTVVAYMLDNPVRRGLVRNATEYKLSGSALCGVEELADLIQIPSRDREARSRPA